MFANSPSQTPAMQTIDLSQLINYALLKIYFEFQWKYKEGIRFVRILLTWLLSGAPVTEVKAERSVSTVF